VEGLSNASSGSNVKKQQLQLIRDRQIVYRHLFAGANSDAVLKDLAVFCRADSSTFNANTHVAAHLDGRREVWLRIQDYLNLTVEELWGKYK